MGSTSSQSAESEVLFAELEDEVSVELDELSSSDPSSSPDNEMRKESVESPEREYNVSDPEDGPDSEEHNTDFKENDE